MESDANDGRLELRDGRTLAWHAYGPTDGRPVLWFHGMPGSRYSRHADEGIFDRLQVRLITFDRPGYGASSRLPARGIAAVADDAAQLLEHLGHETLPVGGVSGGGPYVLALSARHPARVQAATVIVGAAPREEQDLVNQIPLNRAGWYASKEGWDAVYALLAPERDKLLADPLAAFRASMEAAPPDDKAIMTDEAWQRVFVQNVTEALRNGAEGWADEAMALNLDWDFDPSEARSSIAWWHGEHDANAPISAVRRLVKEMPNVDLRLLGETGHLGPYRRYEEMLGELLDRLPSRKS